MASIHHKQSGMKPSYRVVLESSEIDSASSADTRREFSIRGTSYTVIDSASNALINAAHTVIKSGGTAAVIDSTRVIPEAMFFDMDATVIAEESLVEIAKAAGKEREIAELTEKAMAGGMDFKESLRLRLGILKGLRRDQVLAIKPTFNDGIKDLTTWCHDHKIPIFLISGGFVDLAGPVAEILGFKEFKANRFAWNGDLMAGHVEGDIIDGLAKKSAVEHWCKQYGFNPSHCVAVGDGANDLPMMELVGLSVGFCPKKTLWAHLNVSNHTGDHRLLLECMT